MTKLKLKKGNQEIKIKGINSPDKTLSFTYTIREHRQYKINTTPQIIRLLEHLFNRGFKEVNNENKTD